MTRTTAELLADLEVRLEQSLNPGSPRAIARRKEKGLPGPRERIRMLLDSGSFIEVGQMAKNPGAPDNPYGDGVVTGDGTVDGRPVAVFSHDHTVFGGSVGEMFGRKVASIMEFAGRIGCPCVGINDSGGARVTGRRHVARLVRRNGPPPDPAVGSARRSPFSSANARAVRRTRRSTQTSLSPWKSRRTCS
ncbi:putative acyl-CoA carboxylase beta chain [Rhodococcus wratislaviensis NBRC 100605]|uniref:Putative acyl-CoA carboxylase beta chain n=1 Tax=Rhodococcus wratislaviensis NBRC 100605 TaxID=1219028 RepID=X0RJT9_RHOWR|nr:putative acyl-CoA carboxylase beta chain [Rhodococcus wratislaviensis NBRC 100605]